MPLLNTKRYTLNAKKGFTLIELLVVIAIIGILATFVVASFSSAQARGRDSRRKSDLDAIKKALELRKQDTPGGSYYPQCNPDTLAVCNPGNTTPALATTYIKAVPTDPRAVAPYNYTYAPFLITGGACTGAGANCTSHFLSACLENANEPIGGNTYAVSAVYTPGCTTKMYQVANP